MPMIDVYAEAGTFPKDGASSTGRCNTIQSADPQMLTLKNRSMGYLLKSLLKDELVDTVRAVMKGRKRMPSEIASEIAMHAHDEDLTERELSVLRAISKGCSNKIIGAELGISEHTIKNHVQSILAKLGANDRTHAVTIALQRGFIEM